MLSAALALIGPLLTSHRRSTLSLASPKARTVDEFEQTRGLVAYAQNILVADKYGDIVSPYNAMPCETPTIENSRWVTDADPQYILDGTL